jgi:membrane-associated PAP2 superfamily phosphatase
MPGLCRPPRLKKSLSQGRQHPIGMRVVFDRRRLFATAAVLTALIAWDASDLDLRMARWFGGPAGFPLKEDWLFAGVLHEGGRMLSWVVVVGLCLAVWWPFGPLRRIDAGRRLQLVVTALTSVLAISILKAMSKTSCPWDLAEFGRVAHHVSHWSWMLTDGGSGRCFPAGHASAGFAFVGGYFAFSEVDARIARRWLAVAMAAGLLLGLAQQVRGAHFMSHTLWTGAICWCVAYAIDGMRRVAWLPNTKDVEGESIG